MSNGVKKQFGYQTSKGWHKLNTEIYILPSKTIICRVAHHSERHVNMFPSILSLRCIKRKICSILSTVCWSYHYFLDITLLISSATIMQRFVQSHRIQKEIQLHERIGHSSCDFQHWLWVQSTHSVELKYGTINTI